MKIDSHQHFWRYNRADYGWISEEMKVLKQDYLPEELQLELASVGFDGSIAVQARQSLEETAWLLELASQNSYIKGVIGWVDLCASGVRSQLESFSKSPKLVGVRHVIHDEPDDNFMLRSDFLRGIACLRSFGLVYDILVFPRHLPNTLQLIQRFPEQTFVIDHIAKPLIRNEVMEPWKEDITRLAGYKNVYCKLSGMVTEADVNNWKPEDIRPYLDVVFSAFGPDRLLIGSDWPVCRLAGPYKEVMNVVQDYIKVYPEEEKTKILGGNAVNTYKLK
jgi:L-fuconolactonase